MMECGVWGRASDHQGVSGTKGSSDVFQLTAVEESDGIVRRLRQILVDEHDMEAPFE
jgi:hypothetical protein